MVSRRRFLKGAAYAGGILTIGNLREAAVGLAYAQSAALERVALVKTNDRFSAVSRAIKLLSPAHLGGRSVVLKPNFNSSDPFPGSTHNDTLAVLIEELRRLGSGRITVADRAGMGITAEVMEEKGIYKLANQLGFDTLDLDELPADGWESFNLNGWHWSRGVLYPRLFRETGAIVQICNLKTHRFGGHFTLSLKNSVGMVARYSPADDYDYMRELHDSSAQRLMIAEINQLYRPWFVIMDAIEAFVDGGPERGRRARPGVMLAARDRVAIDAVGIAILRLVGTNRTVASGRIFDKEQIARAAQLGIGISSPAQIELVSDDEPGRQFAAKVREILLRG